MTNFPGGVRNNPFARWFADDSFPPRPPDRAVYRYKATQGCLPVLIAPPLAFVGLLDLATDAGTDVGVYAAVPVLFAIFAAMVWLYMVTTAVRVRADGLVIDNLLVRHVIPWERFAGLFADGGAGIFARLEDGTEVKSVAYAPTTKRDLMQVNEHVQETLERMRADCRQARTGRVAASPAPPYRRMLNLPWLPLTGALIVFEAFAWIAFAVHKA